MTAGTCRRGCLPPVCRQRRGLAGRFRTDPDTIACSAAGLAALRAQVPATGASERQEVVLVGCRVLFAPVGDSCLYRCRGGRCRQLTLPFALIAWAMLSITAGLASILNATVPIFTALIGALWLRERLGAVRAAGLVVGFAGVLVLAAGQADFKPGGSGWAIIAMLLATLSYGLAAHLTRRLLGEVPALVSAAGSQIAAAIVLTPLALWFWPAESPGRLAWAAAIALGVACTAFAFLIFFRLIANVGAARAVTVTFLIPLFGIIWGSIFLAERLAAGMLFGGAIVVLGTALATGVLRWPARRPA